MSMNNSLFSDLFSFPRDIHYSKKKEKDEKEHYLKKYSIKSVKLLGYWPGS